MFSFSIWQNDFTGLKLKLRISEVVEFMSEAWMFAYDFSFNFPLLYWVNNFIWKLDSNA